MAVRQIMEECHVAFTDITLGNVVLESAPDGPTLDALGRRLEAIGFSLLGDPDDALVERIRLRVMEWVGIKGVHPRLSAFLQQKLLKDYSALSRLFSEKKGMTIERYSICLRTEKIKEELSYGEKNISEIAYELGYSSPAHLSAQFKQQEGISPKQYQQQAKTSAHTERQPLDRL